MSTLVVLQPLPSVTQQTCMFAVQLAFSPVAKDPKQMPFIFSNLNSAVNNVLIRGNWANNAEAVKNNPEASHVCFKLCDGYKNVQSQNPGVRIEMPAEFFAIAKLCKAVQALRHPAPTIPSVAPPASAVPPPIVAQPTLALPDTDEGNGAAAERGRPKPKPKTKTFKSKATVDTENDEDMSSDEPVIVAEGPATLKLGSSSKTAAETPKRPEIVMMDLGDVPGIDPAAVKKANAKLNASKKARTNSTVTTLSLGVSPSATAIKRAILMLEGERADLDFRIAHSTQQLDLVALELERQCKKLAKVNGDVKGKGKAHE